MSRRDLTINIQDVAPHFLGRTEITCWPNRRSGSWHRLTLGPRETCRHYPLAVGLIVFVVLLAGPLLISVTRTGAAWLVLRDAPTVVLITNSAIATAMLAVQWRVMSTLMERLRRAGALQFGDGAKPEIARAFEKAERWIGRVRHPLFKTLILGVALLLSYVVYREVTVGGRFYESRDWWAEGGLAPYVWVAVFGVGLFFVFIHIASGAIFFQLALRVSRQAMFGVNVDNPDGHYGRRAAHELMVAFYVGFLAYSTSIMVILGPLQGHRSFLLAGIAGFFLALNPFFLYWPIAMLHRHARDSTASRKKLLADRLARAGDDLVAREAVQLQLDRVHAIPTALFRWPGVVAGIVAYSVPPVLSVVLATLVTS